MKNSVKKHKNKDCWGKGEPMATGSAYSKAKAAVILHKLRRQRALDDLETMNALQCKLQRRADTAAGTARLGHQHRPLQGRQQSCCLNEAADPKGNGKAHLKT